MTDPQPSAITPPLPARRLLTLISALLLGVAVGAAVMPALFRATPTDVSRIGTLLAALGDESLEPRIAVFGSSVIMSSIDARQLSRELPGEPLALNLASTGQSLVESYLLHQELPASIRTTVQLVALRGDAPGHFLEPQKYNTFYLFGFRPTAKTRATLDTIFGATVTALLDTSDLAQRFGGRWALRQLVDTRLRRVLRRDLTLARSEEDLYHPQRYSVAYGPARLERSLVFETTRLRGEIGVSTSARRLLRAMSEQRRARGGRLVVLLAPVHPVVRERLGPSLSESVQRLSREIGASGDAIVVDASQSLGAEHFIDAMHSTNAGAVVVTRMLARHLAAL